MQTIQVAETGMVQADFSQEQSAIKIDEMSKQSSISAGQSKLQMCVFKNPIMFDDSVQQQED